eukprot:TRINITY_DN8817_c0_g1_i1.p2 TRINITY_DN8817_c0_g1~~TRINITY_DN8817_c0_g1_i1.p2  ORF type:complete len:185 (+),score=27.29 TRINITY_DN8817_c0_g1_i1:1895-2449(+)
MTTPAPIVTEGAQFMTVYFGQDESTILNLNCSLRHLCDHLAQLLDINDASQLDLANDRGRLSDMPSVTSIETQASTVLKHRGVYVPVLISLGIPPQLQQNDNDALSVAGSISRPSSSISIASRKSSRRGTAAVSSADDSNRNDGELKKYYMVWMDAAAMQVRFPAFELIQRNGTKIKKNYVKRL